MAAATAAAAAAAGGLSPWASFVEESLIMPGRNPGLFLRLVALLFAHTFVFLSLAVRSAHPAILSLLSLQTDPRPRRRFNGFGRDRYSDYYYPSATGGGDEVMEHGRTLLLVYLAYLASKLAAQAAVALAASALARGGRPSALRGRIGSLAATAAFLAALELASTALLAACLASWWATTYDSTAMAASFVSGALLFVLLCVAVPARLSLAAAVPMAMAAVASSAPDVLGGPSALRRAWRLMAARERRKEAAVLVAAAGLLPVVAYPVYAFALACEPGPRDSVFVLLAMLPGYLFPSVAVQLYSTVAAAVFYHRFGGPHEPAAAIPLTTATKAIAS
ncbi:uncharacterized protein LOC104583368 [Brachypodium distachyon]|uniref:Uncharacterized protein n=1 Tax=Brachypodium distachyon TaxID=15368 RepID=I1HUU5_BRADI|nr:uncharacterized protein LOC104583368 [Brachypodium distachyon]KQK11340.1 hypothetical protein BRADI_2g59590v3 [Brachypodium distachyon]|eukprot:XP_010233589.1 uncharacterized protein LOC104583368 [Brachypodium distachyon]